MPEYRLLGFEARYSDVEGAVELLTTQLGSVAVPSPSGYVLATGAALIHVRAAVDTAPSITGLNVETDDIIAAHAALVELGVELESADRDSLVLKDPDNLRVVIWPSQLRAEPNADGPYLHHVSITTLDVRRSSEFYERVLGLRPVYDLVDEASSSIKLRFVADGAFDPMKQRFLLELMGPPLLPREQAAIDRWHGPCFDHYCFVSTDSAALHWICVGHGCETSEEPEFVEEFGLTLSYLFGPDDIEIELIDPPDPELFASSGVE